MIGPGLFLALLWAFFSTGVYNSELMSDVMDIASPVLVTNEECKETFAFVQKYKDFFPLEVRHRLTEWLNNIRCFPQDLKPYNTPFSAEDLLLHIRRLHYLIDVVPSFDEEMCQNIVSGFCRIYQKDVKCDICHASAMGTLRRPATYVEAFRVDYFDPDDIRGTFERTFAFASQKGALNSYYSKSVAIIQCSLSGKTRCMMELSRRIPMIYICNRESDDSGYPISTPDILHWLSTVPDNVNGYADVYVHCRCAALLDVLGTYCVAFIRQCVDSVEEKWEEYLQKFIKIQKTRKFVENVTNEAGPLAEKFFAAARTAGMSEFAWHYVEKLVEIGRTWLPTKPLYPHSLLSWIICIDEARRFAKYVPKGCRNDLLTHLNRVARRLPVGAVFVYMDTYSDINVMTPNKRTGSERSSETGLEQLVLTDVLTWDLGKRCLGHWVPKYMEETFVLERKCLYGRPMWFSLILSKGNTTVIPLAEAKIFDRRRLGGRPVSMVGVEFSREALLALLASRAYLRISPDFGCNSQMVGSYLAHCDLLEANNAAIISYPPDPVVAQASSNIWRENAAYLQKMIECVVNLYKWGSVRTGDRGELVSQILLLLARDRCATKNETNITCAEFLSELMGEEQWRQFSSKMDDDGTWDVFTRGKINFNQFTPVEYTPTRSDLMHFLEISTAVVCKPQQIGIDLIIPVCLDQPYDNPLPETEFDRCTYPYPDNQEGQPIHGADFNLEKLRSDGPLKKYVDALQDLGKPENIDTADPASLVTFSADVIKKEASGQEQSGNGTHLPKASCSYDDLPPKSESNFKLDPRHVSYILIQCKNYGMNTRLPPDLPNFNPWSAGIEDISAPPFLSLGMFYQSSVGGDGLGLQELTVVKKRGHRGGKAVAIVNPHLVLSNPIQNAPSLAQSLQDLLGPPHLIIPKHLRGSNRWVKTAQQRHHCGTKENCEGMGGP